MRYIINSGNDLKNKKLKAKKGMISPLFEVSERLADCRLYRTSRESGESVERTACKIDLPERTHSEPSYRNMIRIRQSYHHNPDRFRPDCRCKYDF